MKTQELKEELMHYRETEANLLKEVERLTKEVDSLKKITEEWNNVKQNQLSEFQPQLHYRKQIVEIEKRLSDQEQYTRRECVELVGLPTELHGDQLEDHVVDVFRTAGVEVNKWSCHVIHRLKNKKVVIAKLVNRQDALSILRGKKKLRNLDEGSKKRLKTQNIYVNESLCPPYWKLLGKCNALLKRKYISNLCLVNGKLKIKRGPTDDRATDIKHEDDLRQIFGDEIINEINKRYKVSMEKSQSAEQSPEQRS